MYSDWLLSSAVLADVTQAVAAWHVSPPRDLPYSFPSAWPDGKDPQGNTESPGLENFHCESGFQISAWRRVLQNGTSASD